MIRIRKVSSKQAVINRKLHAVYEEIDSEREPVCSGCLRNDKPLSHSHTISQKRCKEIGKPELIYDKNNIELECFGDSSCCHDAWASGNIEKQIGLENFFKKLRYIKKNDTGQYTKFAMKAAEKGYI